MLEVLSLRLPDGAQIHIDVEAVPGPGESGHLPSDLAVLFVDLGQVPADHDSGVLLTIDELHYVDVPPSPPSSSACTGPPSCDSRSRWPAPGCPRWPR